MLFRECLDEADIRVELQIFASDVDPDAIATAREGLYPATVASEISETRLARFFVKEEAGFRVSSALRATAIFTVQDILGDPPFSHLDMVSCRNVMIYMQPEAQAKMIGLFHFALRSGGILLLGSSETIAAAEGRFDIVADVERVYRQTGRSLGGRFGFSTSSGRTPQPTAVPGTSGRRNREFRSRTCVSVWCWKPTPRPLF
jgi:two-component system CheB/CheR fusion protein